MKIALTQTREKFPLSSKKPLKKTVYKAVTRLFVILVLAGIAIPLMLSKPQITTILLIVAPIYIISLIIEYIYQTWYYQTYYYELTQSFIIIKKGVIAKKEISIPYERIQDVYVNQDVLDRIFGLYDVHVSTVTITSGMEAHIDGVEKEAAQGLRNLILNTTRKKIGKQGQSTATPAESQT